MNGRRVIETLKQNDINIRGLEREEKGINGKRQGERERAQHSNINKTKQWHFQHTCVQVKRIDLTIHSSCSCTFRNNASFSRSNADPLPYKMTLEVDI